MTLSHSDRKALFFINESQTLMKLKIGKSKILLKGGEINEKPHY